MDPFRALISDLGPCSILDLRPNQTHIDGWCFACVKRSIADPTSFEIYLGDDPHASLPQDTIERIKETLGIDFQSTNLAEILAEILLFRRMPGRGLRPGTDGSYRIHLGQVLLWEATEAEAYEFFGRLQEPDILKAFPNVSSSPTNDLRPALREALRIIGDIVDRGQSGWLLNELERVKNCRSYHPLATNYLIAEELLQQQDFQQLHGSSAALWIFRLGQDMEVTHSQINGDRLGQRLRDPNDCEPTKYELYVMARYLEIGARIEKTDSHRTGEFRIHQSGVNVHIECNIRAKPDWGHGE